MKNKSYIYIVVLSVACIFNSCITNKQTKYLQEGNSYKPVAYQQYKLRVNDEVAYYLLTSNLETQGLYNNGQVGGSMGSGTMVRYRIYEDGTIHLPVGQVVIAGLTLSEAENVVRKAFLRLVPDAEIKLNLVNNYFYVEGDYGKGQCYLYKENLNIYQALAMAGDISNTGDKKHIKIIRKGADGMDYVKTFDLREESIIESEYYYIKPNDVIYIPTNPNSFFRIDSVTSFVSLIVTPISLLVMVLTFGK